MCNLALKNKTIIVTRPSLQAKHLLDLITINSGTAISFPTLEISPVNKPAVIKHKLQNLKAYQWLIFTSSNAVNFAVAANNGKITAFNTVPIIAIGHATARTLLNYGLKVTLMPKNGFNSEAILALPELQNIQQQRILIVRGVGGRALLTQSLKDRGAIVDNLEVYQRQLPKLVNESNILKVLQQPQCKLITITSVECLQNLVLMLKLKTQETLLNLPLIVISQRIKHHALQMGFKQVYVSANPADEAVLETIITVCNGEGSD